MSEGQTTAGAPDGEGGARKLAYYENCAVCGGDGKPHCDCDAQGCYNDCRKAPHCYGCKGDGLSEAGREIATLRRRLAAVEAEAALASRSSVGASEPTDTELLDWWQAQRTNTLAPVKDAEGWRLHEADYLRPLPVPFARTLREAIIAARAALSQEARP